MRARGGAAPFSARLAAVAVLCALAGCGIGGRAAQGKSAASAGARRMVRIARLRGGQDGEEWTWNAEVDMCMHTHILRVHAHLVVCVCKHTYYAYAYAHTQR